MNNEKIEKLAKEIRIKPDVINKDRILADAANALDKAIAAKAPAAGMSLWRTIMNSRITKLAAAAVIIIGIVVLATILNKTISTASAAAVQMLTEAS